MAYNTIVEALERALQQKKLYEKDLLGKSFLYVSLDNNNQISATEVMFTKDSYLHLTGLDYQNRQTQKRTGQILNAGTGALEFYHRLGKDASLINDMTFVQGSTPQESALFFRYTQHKLENLSQLTKISTKAEYIGKYKGNQNFDIIINRNRSAIAFIEESGKHIPVSSLYGKAEDVATNIKPIVAIFSKEKDAHQFTIQYLNKNISLKNVKMDIGLSQRLNISSFENKAVSFNRNQLNELISIYKASVKYDLAKQLNELASKREKAFNSEADMNEYMKSFNEFIKNIDEDYKKDIAIDVLSEQNKEISNELVNEEISEIRNKFQLNASTISTPNVNKPMQMSITEDKPMQIDFSMQGGAAAMTLNPQMPNNEFFTRIANAIAKGVDSLLHKKSDTKRTQVEISDRQQPTPQQSENKTSTPTKAPAPQPVPQKQSLKAMMSKAAQQKKDMVSQQHNNVHNKNPNSR